MKISEMLKREDFYAINARTLNSYFDSVSGVSTYLYIYPYLNVIVTKKPSKLIKEYLYTEYCINSGVKRFLVYAYINICMCTRGLLSSKKIKLKASINDAIMIYPCNKKYRIFDFENGSVSVILKDGFSDKDLLNEIDFRTRENNPLFVPRLLNHSNNSYTEEIIDGGSVARVTDIELKEQLKVKAYQMFRDQYKYLDELCVANEYLGVIKNHIIELLKYKVEDDANTIEAVNILLNKASSLDNIEVVFSHGDLQAGNIWFDKNSNVYIIDWESWNKRSVWYDYATLFDSLRPGDINNFLSKKIIDNKTAVVLLEDIVFQLEELNSLPEMYGLDKYFLYINKIVSWLRGNM